MPGPSSATWTRTDCPFRTADTWTVDAVVDGFDPVLREHREAVGYAIKRS